MSQDKSIGTEKEFWSAVVLYLKGIDASLKTLAKNSTEIAETLAELKVDASLPRGE